MDLTLAKACFTIDLEYLMLEAFKDDPPEFFLLENVPRIRTRGRDLLDQIIRLLAAYGYSIGSITSRAHATTGKFSVADVREHRERHKNVFRVVRWNQESGAITSGHGPTNGGGAVADPRPQRESSFVKYPVTEWTQPTGAVIGGDDAGAYSVTDIRPQGPFRGKGKYFVTPFDEPSNTVISSSTTGHGAYCVQDPGPQVKRTSADKYFTSGAFGVTRWDSPSYAVAGAASYDNGPWSVAEPRECLPAAHDKLTAHIVALDGTWHRPFTTYELAALQNLFEPGEPFELDGKSDSSWREAIGNAVPPAAAKAIADVMGTTLLLARMGQTFSLSAQPIWVRPLARALSVNVPIFSEEKWNMEAES